MTKKEFNLSNHAAASGSATMTDETKGTDCGSKTLAQRVAEAEAEIRQWPAWKKAAANRVYLDDLPAKWSGSDTQSE